MRQGKSCQSSEQSLQRGSTNSAFVNIDQFSGLEEKNSATGSRENSSIGGSIVFGAQTMASDQPIAARLNSRLKPSANHGNQPAIKWYRCPGLRRQSLRLNRQRA